MSRSECENPRSEERARAQIRRILDAARQCFQVYGFHAASMAKIAETAGISQGLAYRYFRNKQAIILAIIDGQLDEHRSLVKETKSTEEYTEKILDFLSSPFAKKPNVFNPVLFLEMCAEASRNPEIMEALEHGDRLYEEKFRNQITQITDQTGQPLSLSDMEERFYALQCLIEGSFCRGIRDPEKRDVGVNRYLKKFITDLLNIP